MDEFEWVDDTDGRVTLQQIDGVETGFAPDVDEVFEVPAHEVLEPGHGADGDMRGVVGLFGRDDALAQVGGGEVFHFVGHLQQCFAEFPRGRRDLKKGEVDGACRAPLLLQLVRIHEWTM